MKAITTETKEMSQEAVNPGNNPYRTNLVISSHRDDCSISFAFLGILPEYILAHL
jgi:hypothetical protein